MRTKIDTQEKRLKILQLASQIGLSSMYDASRDTYSGWSKKILSFAKQLNNLNKEKTDERQTIHQ